MGKELFNNTPSKGDDLINDVKNVRIGLSELHGRSYGKITRYVT